ncbi:hypothetical protein E2C01_015023 [Portunus trituberculatus]|uniref:Uncharacterized protein n=1 Tax=Portunus trituberculatus TaxID=210409 RepID=A0A5B7DLK9_PORTR|nr:hypothetical protein [Portunus trituberculatus]
MYMKNKVRN